IVQCHGGPGLEPLLEHGAVEVVTDDEEAPEGELAEGAGLADGGRKGRPVQVGEDRAGARVDAEALALLTGVLEGGEERLADRASGPLEGGEEVEVLLGQGPFGDSGPIAGDRATFVEIGRHQVHHLVERGCEGDLIRCDGGVAVVGRLEDPGVAYDLGRRRRRLRAEPHQDRKSTRLKSSHVKISYAVFCMKKKIKYISFPARTLLCYQLFPYSTRFRSRRSSRSVDTRCTTSWSADARATSSGVTGALRL